MGWEGRRKARYCFPRTPRQKKKGNASAEMGGCPLPPPPLLAEAERAKPPSSLSSPLNSGHFAIIGVREGGSKGSLHNKRREIGVSTPLYILRTKRPLSSINRLLGKAGHARDADMGKTEGTKGRRTLAAHLNIPMSPCLWTDAWVRREEGKRAAGWAGLSSLSSLVFLFSASSSVWQHSLTQGGERTEKKKRELYPSPFSPHKT